MKPRVYLETTIVSYLAAWPSRDIVISAHQQITHEWWRNRRSGFDVLISQVVIQEARMGDKAAAERRMELIKGIPVLELNEPAKLFAKKLMDRVPLPQKAEVDAFHVAVAVINGMDFLLTWNCTHLANAKLRSKIEGLCRLSGYQPIIICTPEELTEE